MQTAGHERHARGLAARAQQPKWEQVTEATKAGTWAIHRGDWALIDAAGRPVAYATCQVDYWASSLFDTAYGWEGHDTHATADNAKAAIERALLTTTA